jgi:hypothetical protein
MGRAKMNGVSEAVIKRSPLNLSGRKEVIKNLIKVFLLMYSVVYITEGSPLMNVCAIGHSADSNSHSINSSGFELRGWGEGFIGNADNILFAYGNPTGNFDLSTRCSFISDNSNKSEAGLMVRSDTAANAQFCSIEILQEKGTIIRYRAVRGGTAKTVEVSPDVYEWLRIKRTGPAITFYYKIHSDSAWKSFQTSFSFSFPDLICAGVMHTSNSESGLTSSTFDFIEGLPEKSIVVPSCNPVNYDFRIGSLDSLGFRQIKHWSLDTGHNIRTTISNDSAGLAEILSPPVSMKLGVDTVSVSWDLLLNGDTLPQLSDYSLFSTEELILNDRAKICGLRIGSAAGINTGIDDTIFAEVRGGGQIQVRDRSYVKGNVLTRTSCSLINGASVNGTITQNATLSFPTIPSKIVDTGTVPVILNPNDSIDLTPGHYSKLIAYGNSRIRFRPGEYSFSKFNLEPDVRIYLSNKTGKIDINIYDSMRIGDRLVMIPNDTTISRNITIFSRQSTMAYFGTNLILYGKFTLPNAEAHLTSRTMSINGGIYARKISFEPDVSVTITSQPEYNNTFTSKFIPTDSTQPVYSFTLSVHRGIDQNAITDFLLKRDSTIICAVASGSPTPLNKWLNFEFVISPSDSISRMRLLYNKGNGQVLMMDTVPFRISTISSLKYEYLKKDVSANIISHLDNISLSCVSDTCGHLILLKNPSDTSVCENGTAIFSCSVDAGNFTPVYQWFKNGTPIPWTNSPEYVVRNASLSDGGSNFCCHITTPCAKDTTTMAVLNVLNGSPPRITDPPDSASARVGQKVTFSVNAQGEDLKYQWMRNNEEITGANSSTYILEKVEEFNNLDQFRVKVRNKCGGLSLSDAATLVVTDVEPCKITQQPFNDTIIEGDYYQTQVQTICVNGNYQWYRNGNTIIDATSKNLVFGPARIQDNGSEFFCVVNNGIINDTSNISRLTVRSIRDGNSSISISGELFDGRGRPVGVSGSAVYNFKIKLYTVKTAGTPLYTEIINGIRVRDTVFTITLGHGKSEGGDLQKIANSYSELYAEVYAGQNGNFELTAPRLRLTAAPYAFTSGIKVIYGRGSPVSASVNAPIGTMYIDGNDSKTWKLGKNGWIKLD